jgi:hypothetical protein
MSEYGLQLGNEDLKATLCFFWFFQQAVFFFMNVRCVSTLFGYSERLFLYDSCNTAKCGNYPTEQSTINYIRYMYIIHVTA